MLDDDGGFPMLETLCSIPDPEYRKNSEIVASFRRVGIATQPNWSDAKWSILVKELSKKLGAPDYIRDSVIQYRPHHRSSMKHLHQREAASALLFLFSKNYLKAGKSLREICEACGANRAKAGKYLTHFILDDGMRTEYKHPEDYLSLYGSRLNVAQEIVHRGFEIAGKYSESFSGSTPRTIAASALYLATKENGHHYTQKEIAETFGIAAYTIREVSSNIRRFLEASTSAR